jgi:DNA gyrase subunit A
MSKADLMRAAHISPNTMTKIRKNEEVSMTILNKICVALGVTYGDIVEYVHRNADAESKYIVKCKNTGRICLFTDSGQLHTIKVMDLPYGKFRDKGIPIDNISNFSSEKENIVYITSQTEINLRRLMFVTEQAMLKIVDGGEFDVAKRTVAATKLQDNDKVVNVVCLTEQRNIVLQSKAGYFLRFPIEEIPEKKKGAIGVRGMKLAEDDLIEAVYYTQNAVESTIQYKSKNLVLNSIKLGKRDTKGIKVRA